MKTLPLPNTTARELLVHAAGAEHSTHSIVGRKKASKGFIALTCSCGSSVKVEPTTMILAALKSVPEDMKS